MSILRHRLKNAAIALLCTVIWVLLAGMFSWGGYSSNTFIRILANVLASPYTLSGLFLSETVGISVAIALQFGICFIAVSALKGKRTSKV